MTDTTATDPVSLVASFGSPLYVYQLASVRSAVGDLIAALPRPSTLFFSLKANPLPMLGCALREAGCRAEVSSTGELVSALTAGFEAERCLYTGPGKSPEEVETALLAGVVRFSVESREDLHMLGAVATRLGLCADVLVRVNGDLAGTSGLRMTGVATQFGIDEDQLSRYVDVFTSVPGTRLVGTHQYAVSGARDEAGLIESLRSCIRLAARLEAFGIPTEVVDIGGGFASPYAQPGVRPTYPTLAAALEETLDAELPGWRTGRTEVCFESGRFLVGDSGRLIATVRSVKQSRGKTYVVLDAGINHLAGLTGLGRLARPTATPEGHDRGSEEARSNPVTLVGPLCTPADVLSHSVELAEVEKGAHLVFPHVGAYGLTASLVGFLSRPAPVEVVLDGNDVVSATRLQLMRQSVPLAMEDE